MSDSDSVARALGWHGPLPLPPEPDLCLARVAEQHRDRYLIDSGEALISAQIDPSLRALAEDPVERPAMGDWVWFRQPPQLALILACLPRRSLLKRTAAGETGREQVIACNIDYALLVMALNRDFNPRRAERYLLLIHGSGALPLIVLTRADEFPDSVVADRVAELRALIGSAVPVLAVNARDPDSVAALRPWFEPGDSLVLVGSSGAGKSTLTNALAGIERQQTGAIRDSDQRGRHTTTRRTLLRLPGELVLIDTPGMRELKLSGDEDLGDGPFADIVKLAEGCRFSDCRHSAEPGCAIAAALDSGELDPGRWQNYQKLAAELADSRQRRERDPARRAEARRLTKALGKRLEEKYDRR